MIDRDTPTCISRNKSIQDALTLMAENDFSQLPVVDQAGNLTGMISEKTILNTYFITQGQVRLLELDISHCESPAVTISPENDIFDALDLLQNEYAIIVVENQQPTGILTNFDTTHFFRDLSEGLIYIEDIELTLRDCIQQVFPEEEVLDRALLQVVEPDSGDSSKPIKDIEALTFFEYMRVITAKENWPSFQTAFEPRGMFVKMMDPVRQIRNQLAHFRGRLEPLQRSTLIHARNWLDNRPSLVEQNYFPLPITPIQVAEAPAVYQTNKSGKYALLQEWLEKQDEKIIRVSFEDIQTLLGTELPASARNHRSWWANDHTHSQALAWLQAGWKIEDIQIAEETVVFKKEINALRQLYLLELLGLLKSRRPGITQVERRPVMKNWLSFGLGRPGFGVAWVFTIRKELQVELYIDTGDKEANKREFDALFHQKETIEKDIGSELRWERLDEKRACRISLAIPMEITDPPEKLEDSKPWALDTMIKFVDVFKPLITNLE